MWQVPKSWIGGSEKFFISIWGTHISSYDTLRVHLRFLRPPVQWKEQLEAALADGDHHGETFDSLITAFLKGSGTPRPSAFSSVTDHFNPIINLRNINDDGFRARMFCWATTGSSERASDASPIMVDHILPHSFLPLLIRFI